MRCLSPLVVLLLPYDILFLAGCLGRDCLGSLKGLDFEFLLVARMGEGSEGRGGNFLLFRLQSSPLIRFCFDMKSLWTLFLSHVSFMAVVGSFQVCFLQKPLDHLNWL
ncbi:hypothetical protein QQP08_004403 [Theobroma cacao]|nr:hypothetical protein QQP08_004403 [Theobroma cacao]